MNTTRLTVACKLEPGMVYRRYGSKYGWSVCLAFALKGRYAVITYMTSRGKFLTWSHYADTDMEVAE